VPDVLAGALGPVAGLVGAVADGVVGLLGAVLADGHRCSLKPDFNEVMVFSEARASPDLAFLHSETTALTAD